MYDGGSVFGKMVKKPHFYKDHLHCRGRFEPNIVFGYFYFEYYREIFEPLWSPQVEFKAISYLFEIQAGTTILQDLEF